MALQAGPLNMPYALQKLRLMDEKSFDPGFAVESALKDIDLVGESVTLSPLFQVVRHSLERTAAAGHGDQDLAALDAFRGTSESEASPVRVKAGLRRCLRPPAQEVKELRRQVGINGRFQFRGRRRLVGGSWHPSA